MKIGLALGSGAARGWAHIGIIKALNEHGIFPDIVCGTSVGALVGAAYLAGNLDKLEEGVLGLTKFKTTRFFEINASMNGFISNQKLISFLNRYVADGSLFIDDLPQKYVAVATDFETGREVWLRNHTPLQEALRASIAIPGLFPPMRYKERWLLDGALVNPVPVSVCRALGADIVIAVNLDGDFLGRHLPASGEPMPDSMNTSYPETAAEEPQKDKETPPVPATSDEKNANGVVSKLTNLVNGYSSASFFIKKEAEDRPPGVFDIITKAINITQDRITRSRMAGDPPDILIAPKSADVGLLDFYRAEKSIQAGHESVERVAPEIQYVINYQSSSRSFIS